MMNYRIPLICASAALLALAARSEDDLNAAARKILTNKQDSVVWISAIAKTSFTATGAKDSAMNVPDQESKVEALATIIDPSGLAVTMLSQVDPGRNVSGRSVRTAQGVVKVEASSTLKEVKVIMPDGTEIPAEIVMKDADLDLAFVRIKASSKEAKGVAFQAVDLKDSAPGGILDEVVTISRMDEVLNRVPSVARGQINTITKKPHQFLRAGGAIGGCPTFLVNGKLLGITAARLVTGKSPWAVIIPAADVLEIAEQAKNVKPAAETPTKQAAGTETEAERH
ncbi:MAG: serine protease [Verrucomicrobia bacterium]|nr:serine protease [Verrucomicrobiota bacterium]